MLGYLCVSCQKTVHTKFFLHPCCGIDLTVPNRAQCFFSSAPVLCGTFGLQTLHNFDMPGASLANSGFGGRSYLAEFVAVLLVFMHLELCDRLAGHVAYFRCVFKGPTVVPDIWNRLEKASTAAFTEAKCYYFCSKKALNLTRLNAVRASRWRCIERYPLSADLFGFLSPLLDGFAFHAYRVGCKSGLRALLFHTDLKAQKHTVFTGLPGVGGYGNG